MPRGCPICATEMVLLTGWFNSTPAGSAAAGASAATGGVTMSAAADAAGVADSAGGADSAGCAGAVFSCSGAASPGVYGASPAACFSCGSALPSSPCGGGTSESAALSWVTAGVSARAGASSSVVVSALASSVYVNVFMLRCPLWPLPGHHACAPHGDLCQLSQNSSKTVRMMVPSDTSGIVLLIFRLDPRIGPRQHHAHQFTAARQRHRAKAQANGLLITGDLAHRNGDGTRFQQQIDLFDFIVLMPVVRRIQLRAAHRQIA
ncbi:hypothetical protein COLO4_02480, partial [Corchorus olitorius]